MKITSVLPMIAILISVVLLGSVSAAQIIYLSDKTTAEASFNGDVREVTSVSGNTAISFNGLDSYISVKLPDTTSTTVTVAGWFYTKSLVQEKNEITGSWISRRSAYILSPNTDGSVSFYVFLNGNWYSATSAQNEIQQNVWEHWAGTYDGTTIKLYHNTALVAQTEVSIASNIGIGNTLCIGHDCGLNAPHDNRYFNGDVDEISIYDNALSVYEIKSIYNSQRPLFYQGAIKIIPSSAPQEIKSEFINAGLDFSRVTQVERVTDSSGQVTGYKEIVTGKIMSVDEMRAKRKKSSSTPAPAPIITPKQIITRDGIYTVIKGDTIEWLGTNAEIKEISWALQGDTEPKLNINYEIAGVLHLHATESDYVYRGPVTAGTKVYQIYVISIEKNELNPELSRAKIAIAKVD